MASPLPHIRQPIAGNASVSVPFYNWFQRVSDALNNGTLSADQIAADVRAIATALGSPTGTTAGIRPLTVAGGGAIAVTGSQTAGWFVSLETQANSGTGTLQAITRDGYGRVSGTKAATITGTAGRVTVANGDAAVGLPTLDLATVADAGGGTLQKTAFDTYGRKTGSSAATTTDLPEGTNLYHTAGRVLATVLTGLSTATNAVITVADSVLGALGKLQAQISGIVANYVTTARTISTTAPLTGGGDLSADRTLGIDAATTLAPGSMSAADKGKLDGVAAGATAYTDAMARTAAVADTITDAVTTVAPSQNAVFDALAGKFDKAGGTITGPTTVMWNAFIVDSASTNSTFFRLRNTAPGGRAFVFYSSGGGPSAAGTFGIYDDTAAIPRLFIDTSGHLLPGADNTQNLGSATSRWAGGFVRNLHPGAGTVIWTSGTGTPEGVVVAPVGSLFTRTDGGAGTTLYVKQSGTGSAGWAAK